MNKIKIIFMFGVFLLVVPFFLSFVNAFGIAVSYWEPDNPLRLQPGESVDITFRLQNSVEGGEEITLVAELTEGGEIATIIDESKEYVVPAGSESVRTNIRISIPEDAPLGSKYIVAVGYTQVTEDEGKTVQVAARIVQNIPVIVGEETVIVEEPELALEGGISTTNIILGILVVLVIIVILRYLLKRKK